MATDICNYADDTTIYACDKTVDSVVARLESDSSMVIQWFGDTFMKLTADKCHLLILGRNSYQQVTLNKGDSVIENTEEERLMDVVINKNLLLTNISKLCKKAASKLSALASIAGYMDPNKLRILMRAFVISQYQYRPLVWMFHSRQLKNFNVLLENDCSVSMHVKNL